MAGRSGPPSRRPGRRQDDPGVVAERRRSATVSPWPSPSTRIAQGVLDGLEPVLALHRAGGVDDEGQGGIVAGPVADVARLQADAQQDLVRLG